MVGVSGVEVCPICGEEYEYYVDCTTMEYMKSMCKCDRFAYDAEEFLKRRGLWEEFLKFHEERERAYKQRRKRKTRKDE
jgi:proteasome assembly chaperone (PAC2) family protein